MLNKYMDQRIKTAEGDARLQSARIADLMRRIAEERSLLEKNHKLGQQIHKLKKIQLSDENAEQQNELKKRLKTLKTDIEQNKAKITELHTQIENKNALDQQLKAALTIEADLRKRLSSQDANDKIDIQNKINADIADAAKSQADVDKLRAEIDKLKEQIAQAERNSQARGDSVAYRSASMQPVYIECAGSGITIYRQSGDNVEQMTINSYAIDNSQELSAVLGEVAADNKKNGKKVVNVLVRPGGVKTYDDFRSVLENSAAPWASQPIAANGKLEFASVTKESKN